MDQQTTPQTPEGAVPEPRDLYASAVFFKDRQTHFFRPFTWRTRERFAACVVAVYDRLLGPEAVFNKPFDRDAITEVVDRALAAAPKEILPVLGEEPVDAGELDAARVIRDLAEHGWLEVYTDSASVKRVWRFTALGKKFARALWESGRPVIRTRQRNMRSCAAALEHYVERGDVDDLIDAHSYAESVLEDLSGAIEAMRGAMLDATRGTNLRTTAVEEFRTFLVERFRKEHAPGLTADSAVRLKSRITEALTRLYGMHDERLRQLEDELRDRLVASEFETTSGRQVFRMADRISRLVQNAVDTKVPELVGAWDTYISRMTSLVRQTSSGAGAVDDPVRVFVDDLREADESVRDALLSALAEDLATSRVRIYEPRDFRFEVEIQQVPVTPDPVTMQPTIESVVEAEISRRFEDLLIIDEADVLEYVIEAAVSRGGRVKLSEMPIAVARDLLLALSANVIILSTAEVPIRTRLLPRRIECEYFEADDIEFILEVAR